MADEILKIDAGGQLSPVVVRTNEDPMLRRKSSSRHAHDPHALPSRIHKTEQSVKKSRHENTVTKSADIQAYKTYFAAIGRLHFGLFILCGVLFVTCFKFSGIDSFIPNRTYFMLTMARHLGQMVGRIRFQEV